MADIAWNHVIPRDSSRNIASNNGNGVGATLLTSENKIIATCRAVYQQVIIYSLSYRIYIRKLCVQCTYIKKEREPPTA